MTENKEKGVYVLRDRDEKGEPISAAKDPSGNRGAGPPRRVGPGSATPA